ncbi:MAG: cytochrome c [Gammaproteobacteria bacterium]|nr:MAG: cytochrome c [Gammaproteobacteria bacterium]
MLLRNNLLVVLVLCWCLPASAQPPDPSRQKQIIHLLKHDCGSCHGMSLQGGLGPALTSQALKNKPLQYLEATISAGRAGTPMPPWLPFLTPVEIHWLVQQLKQGIK